MTEDQSYWVDLALKRIASALAAIESIDRPMADAMGLAARGIIDTTYSNLFSAECCLSACKNNTPRARP